MTPEREGSEQTPETAAEMEQRRTDEHIAQIVARAPRGGSAPSSPDRSKSPVGAGRRSRSLPNSTCTRGWTGATNEP
jgi:hypothetical protein